MKDAYDILIVGAGPAGSSAAIRLADAGKSVLLIEKERFPREKLCGEFISPECLDHFQELGTLGTIRSAGGVDIAETVFYSRRGRGIAVPSTAFGSVHQSALGLSRAEMDLQLVKRAEQVGVEVRQETAATGLVVENERVTGLRVKGGGIEETVRAELVVDGTGRTRALARKRDGSSASRARFVAFKAHVRNVEIPDDRCEIFSYRGGYGGTSRVEQGLHNICFIVSVGDVKRLGSDADRVFREVVCSNRRAARVFRNVECIGDWLAVPVERFGRGMLSPVTGLLTIGDAAAFIDPFTGSGMLLALESAKVATQAILTANDVRSVAAEYERHYRAAFDRRLRLCAWLRRVSFVPFLAEIVIGGLGLSSTLRSRLVRETRANVSTSSIR